MNYAEALADARRQLAALDPYWATASDADVVREATTNPTLFIGQDALKAALLGQAAGQTGIGAWQGGPSGLGVGTYAYPNVNLPDIFAAGEAMGLPTLDWMKFLEARRQFDVQQAFQQAANPRNWMANWALPQAYPGGLPQGGLAGLPVPEWLRAMTGWPTEVAEAQNVAYPWQVSLPDYTQMAPSQQQALQGFYSSMYGYSPEDVVSAIQQTRPLASSLPGAGTWRWAF